MNPYYKQVVMGLKMGRQAQSFHPLRLKYWLLNLGRWVQFYGALIKSISISSQFRVFKVY